MALRRPRLSIRPNIGPRLNKSNTEETITTSVNVLPLVETKPGLSTSTSTNSYVSECKPVIRRPMKRFAPSIVAKQRPPHVSCEKKVETCDTKTSSLPCRDTNTDITEDTQKDIKKDIILTDSNDTQNAAIELETQNEYSEICKSPSEIKNTPSVTIENIPKSSDNDISISSKHITDSSTSVNHVSTFQPPRIRSRFPKARPNISDAGRNRIRHTSCSSLSGEEEVRPALHKEEHFKPTFTSTQKITEEVKEQFSKPQEKNTNTSKRSNTEEIVLNDDAINRPKKKWRTTEVLETPVDRYKMTLRDLIYMNPSTNPMSTTNDESAVDASSISDKNEIILNDQDSEVDIVSTVNETSAEGVDLTHAKSNEDTEVNDEDDDMLVPQVTVGADGQIIISEKSLVIEAPDEDTTSAMELLHESIPENIGYGKRAQVKLWSRAETKKFYLALSAIGSDFSLMAQLFPKRSRTDLKRKFKKEEKINQILVDGAMKEKHLFDEGFFQELQSLDVEEADEREKKKLASERKPRKRNPDSNKFMFNGNSKKGKKCKATKLIYSDSGSEADDSSPVCSTSAGQSDESKEHDKGLSSTTCANFKRTITRSGRQSRTPKHLMDETPDPIISLSSLPDNTDPSQIQAGSLVLVHGNETHNDNSENTQAGSSTGMIHVYLVSDNKDKDAESTYTGHTNDNGSIVIDARNMTKTDDIVGKESNNSDTLIIDPVTGLVTLETQSG